MSFKLITAFLFLLCTSLCLCVHYFANLKYVFGLFVMAFRLIETIMCDNKALNRLNSIIFVRLASIYIDFFLSPCKSIAVQKSRDKAKKLRRFMI